tara:strand:+ start:2075 stop:2899 length:825 start_codon:yes stop_codon:yes gene_type:complete
MNNKDEKVIQEFGEEWTKFNYFNVDRQKIKESFDQYFHLFPWDLLPEDAEGFDMGCGTGRWAGFVAPKVKLLNCIEPSAAIQSAQTNLSSNQNIRFYKETTDECSITPSSQDFGYCLGVLHHIPNTQKALIDCTKLLKSGAPFLLYLYYNFENKPFWFRAIWKVSDYMRMLISISPKPLKHLMCNLIAVLIYFPLSRLAYLLEKIGLNVENIPLADYRNKPFYQSKNDALDRFGTRLEQRFSKSQITDMLMNAGCKNIKFSNQTPFWCCVSIKE